MAGEEPLSELSRRTVHTIVCQLAENLAVNGGPPSFCRVVEACIQGLRGAESMSKSLLERVVLPLRGDLVYWEGAVGE